MKKLGLLIATSLSLALVTPLFATENTATEKDQCLLSTKNCKNEVDSIQIKIKKLEKEIKKGKSVYSAEEINKLNEKLKEANDLLDDLFKGGK